MKNLVSLYLSIAYQLKPGQTLNSALTCAGKLAWLVSLSLCTGVLTSACSAAEEPTTTAADAPTLSQRIQAIDSQVNDMINDIYCEAAQDCAFVPMGERACGGPSSYKIYSNRMGDEAINKLQRLAAEYTALTKKYNEKSGLISTCEIYPMPSLLCVENKCIKNESQHQTY